MSSFKLGYSTASDTPHRVRECLGQIGDLAPEANLGFLYATDVLAPELSGMLRLLRQETGITHWVGTLGVGILTTGREYYDGPAVAVMIADFPPDALRMIPTQKTGIDQFITEAQGWYLEHPAHFGIVHGDPTSPMTPALIERLTETVPGAFLVGGLTSSQSEENLQIAGEVTSGGISGVLFSSAVPVAVSHTQGCSPIGPKHVITYGEHNVIAELDHRPALEVLKEDIGDVLARDLSRIGGYIFAGLPIAGSDTDDYLVRNLIGLDTTQGLIAIGERVTEGHSLMFCQRDGNTARADMLRMLAGIKRRLPAQPRGAVYYSCLGRGRYQFGEDSEELKIIRDELGDIPLVGFFANGEVFHNRVYGYTGVLAVFG